MWGLLLIYQPHLSTRDDHHSSHKVLGSRFPLLIMQTFYQIGNLPGSGAATWNPRSRVEPKKRIVEYAQYISRYRHFIMYNVMQRFFEVCLILTWHILGFILLGGSWFVVPSTPPPPELVPPTPTPSPPPLVWELGLHSSSKNSSSLVLDSL